MKKLKAEVVVEKGGKMPKKGEPQATCYDMYARSIDFVGDNLVKVMLGVKIKPQEGYRVAVYPRGSISKTGWILANSIGIGEEEFTGEWRAYFIRVNPTVFGAPTTASNKRFSDKALKPEFPWKVGERCCQFELVERYDLELEQVDKLEQTQRGGDGFGSTGKN